MMRYRDSIGTVLDPPPPTPPPVCKPGNGPAPQFRFTKKAVPPPPSGKPAGAQTKTNRGKKKFIKSVF